MKRHFYFSIALALALGVSSCNKEDENNNQNEQITPVVQTTQLESEVTNEVKVDDLEILLTKFEGDEVTIKVTDYDHSKVMAAIYRAGKKLSGASVSKSFSLSKEFHLPFKVNLIIPEGVKNLELKTDELTDEEKADIEQNGIPMIAKVEIPKTVETIGSNAFKGCVSLEEVKVPQTIKTIGTNAFEGCQSLTKIELPKTVETIEEAAFKGCQKLEEVKIPESVKTISSSVFEGCSNLAKVEIPESVEKIDNNAFKGCESLSEVEIPQGVKEIGQAVFEDCKSLEIVIIPETIETIADDVFVGCESLETISIPENVQIEQNFVPENIKVVVNGVKCSELEEYLKNSKEEIVTITPIDYDHMLVRHAIAVSGKNVRLIIPEDVAFIGKYVGDYIEGVRNLGKIVSVEFPKNLRYIGFSAFSQCDITELNLPNTLDSIGSGAFVSCKFLTKVEIPESVIHIGDQAFSNDSLLSEVKLPSGLSKISYSLFDNTSLRTITLPNTIEEIGNSAFYNCRFLESIVIPSSVNRIGSEAFMNCEKLSDIIFEGDPSIGTHAFKNSGFEYTPELFEDAQALDKFLKQSNKVDAYVKVENYDHTAVIKAIKGSNKNVSLVIPEGVRYIDRDTMQNIQGNIPELVCVEFPTTLGVIGKDAFKGCTGLYDVDFPASLEEIGYNAFQGCTNLSVFKGNNVNFVGNYAFEGCSNLFLIVVWNPITFNSYSFANTNLTTISGIEYTTIVDQTVFLNAPGSSYLR